MRKKILCFSLVFAFIFGILPVYALAADSVSNDKAAIKTDHIKDGYIQAAYLGKEEKKIKLTIEKGQSKYTYDLNNKGDYETFTLQMGNGDYKVKVLQNISGTKYAVILTADIKAEGITEFAPFLVSNQFVHYSSDNEVIKKATTLSKDAKDDLTKVSNIYNFVVDAMDYDSNKAKTVQSGYLPNIDAVVKAKKGICFDYAAVLAAMLRSQEIPTKLITGYVAPNNVYHAWNEVYITDVGWVKLGDFYFDGKSWERMDPTFTSSGNKSDEIAKYIGNGSNYSTKYTY